MLFGENMSIHPKIVDAIGTERATDEVSLTIADSQDWSDVTAHLEALQEKINAYLGFMESGEIYEKYPAAKGKKMNITIIFRFAPPEGEVMRFLAHAEQVVHGYGFGFAHRVHE